LFDASNDAQETASAVSSLVASCFYARLVKKITNGWLALFKAVLKPKSAISFPVKCSELSVLLKFNFKSLFQG
jgi:hypothetical protein